MDKNAHLPLSLPSGVWSATRTKLPFSQLSGRIDGTGDASRYQTISWRRLPIGWSKSGLRNITKQGLQFRFQGNISGRSPRPVEPGVERVSGQPVFRSRISRCHGELVQPHGFILHVFAPAKALNRQPDGLVQGPRIQFNRVLNTV